MIRFTALLATALVLLAGCSMLQQAPPPDATAKDWMTAFTAQDGTTLASLTCAASRQQLASDGGELNMLNALASGAAGGQTVKYSAADLTYNTVNSSDSSATVHVGGTLHVAVGLASNDAPVNLTVALAKEDGQWRVCSANG